MDNKESQLTVWDTKTNQQALEHTIGFYKGVDQAIDGRHLRSVGTGTLVQYKGRRGILTASHVVEALLNERSNIVYRTHKNVLRRHFERQSTGRRPEPEIAPNWYGGNCIGQTVADRTLKILNGKDEEEKDPDIGLILLTKRMAVELQGEHFYGMTQERVDAGADQTNIQGELSATGLTSGAIGELDSWYLDQDGEITNSPTVLSVIAPLGNVRAYRSGRHRYEYGELMLKGKEYNEGAAVDTRITSYGGLSGSGVWRRRRKDANKETANDETSEILLCGIIIEEDGIKGKDSRGVGCPDRLIYHTGRTLFNVVETMFASELESLNGRHLHS